MLGTYHLNGLFDILKELHFIYEPDKLWKFVLEKSCQVLQAEAGTFYLATANGTELEVETAFGADEGRLKQVPFHAGVGICGWVLQFQQPALVADVDLDNRFNRGVDAVTGIRTQSILCVPVISQKRVYGVIELINRKNGQFGPKDQEFMTVLGRQSAAAYQNLMLFNEVAHAKILLQSVLENLSGGLIAIDTAGLITIINPAAVRLLDIAVQTPVGQPATNVLKNHSWCAEILQKTLSEKVTVSRQEVHVPLHGQESRVGYSTLLISDALRKLMGSGIIFQQLPNK